MSDNPPESGQELVSVGKDLTDEIEIPARDIIELERERISLERERTQVAHQMFNTLNEAHERDFQVHMASLENDKLRQEANERHDRRMYRLLTGVSFALLAVIVFFLLMMFFGDERQSNMVSRIMKVVVQTVGSGSVFLIVLAAVRRLFRHR